MFRLILIFFICVSSANAITLTQTTASDVVFDLSLVAPTDAGDYFNNSYTRDNTTLTIDDIPNNTKWKVYAKLSVLVRSGQRNIEVRIKRQGNGTGVNPLGGNTGYETLNNTTFTEIFSGEGSRSNIPVRTQIKGIGVNDDFGTFDTTIEFKVETY